MKQRLLLLSGIAAPVLYLFTDVIASFYWKEYSANSQTISEFIAINAPTRWFVVPLFTIYAILVYAFGIGVWNSALQKRVLHFIGSFLIIKEILGLTVTLFFPIHLRGVEGNYSDVVHGILTGIGVLSILLAIGFSTVAFGKMFRWYSILTIVILIACGLLAGMLGKQYTANEPTPWMGVLERINIYGFLLWNVVLSLSLLYYEKKPNFKPS